MLSNKEGSLSKERINHIKSNKTKSKTIFCVTQRESRGKHDARIMKIEGKQEEIYGHIDHTDSKTSL